MEYGDGCHKLPRLDEFLEQLEKRYEQKNEETRSERNTGRQERNGEAKDWDDILKNGRSQSERSDAFQALVWHFLAKGWSVEQVEAELRKYPKGIADKYLNPKDRLAEEIARSCTKWREAAFGPYKLEDFNAYLPKHKYIFRPTGEIWSGASINALLPNPAKEVSPTDWLVQHRAVAQITWAPGMPTDIEDRLIKEGGWFEFQGSRVFNLYRPAVLVLRQGSVAPWREHLETIYPNEANHIERWFAHRVQKPGEKLNHALVLGGEQGIGKDTLLEPVKEAVGPWNYKEASPKQAIGRFNEFLKAVILRVSEARDLGEVDRYSFYDASKTMIAAPPYSLRIDEKLGARAGVPRPC